MPGLMRRSVSLWECYWLLKIEVVQLRVYLSDINQSIPEDIRLPSNFNNLTLEKIHKCALAISDLKSELRDSENLDANFFSFLENIQNIIQIFATDYINTAIDVQLQINPSLGDYFEAD